MGFSGRWSCIGGNVPTLTPSDWEPGPTNGEWLVMLGIPALAALGVLFVLFLERIGQL